LAKIKAVKGEAVAKAVMIVLVNNLAQFFNVGRNLNSEQILETIRLIQQQYFYLTIADFKLCFEEMKLSTQAFDRFDGNMILAGIEDYVQRRAKVAEELSLQKAEESGKLIGDGNLYTLKCDGWYVVKIGNEYDWTDDVTKASPFDWNTACNLRRLLEKEIPEDKGNVHRKVEMSLYKPLSGKIEVKKPIQEPETFEQRRKRIEKAIKHLELTVDDPYELNCKIRELNGLKPLSKEEFENPKND
jgi:hypothetical protein